MTLDGEKFNLDMWVTTKENRASPKRFPTCLQKPTIMIATSDHPHRRSLSAAIALVAAILLPPNAGAQVVGEEVLPSGSDWEYLLYAPDNGGGVFTPADPTTTDVDFYTTWQLGGAGYDGPAFQSGAAPLGYGAIDGGAIITNVWGGRGGLNEPLSGERFSAYFRTTVSPTANATGLRFTGITDDGAIIYVNGVEVGRTSNMPAGADTWNLLATGTGSETVAVTLDVTDLSLPGGTAVTVAVAMHQQSPSSSDMGMNFQILTLIPETITAIALDPELTYPTEDDPAVVSSAAAGTIVGILSARSVSDSEIQGVPLSLVAGNGDTNNALYVIAGNELRVSGALSGIDGVLHTVRVQGSGGGGDFSMPITFTVVLDSDNDMLPDNWELMFGTLGDFATGGDADGDGKNDEVEFERGTNPSQSEVLPRGIFFQDFDDGLGPDESIFGAFSINDTHTALSNGTPMMGHSMAYGPLGGAASPLPSYSFYELELDLRGASEVELRFDLTGGVEKDFDGFNLLASTDGPITPPNGLLIPTAESELQYGAITVHADSSPELGPTAWFSSIDPSVIQSVEGVFDLSAFENQIVTLRFQFGTDALEGGEGVNIDNIFVDGFSDQRSFAITSIIYDGNDAVITWNSRIGSSYALDFSTDLTQWFEIDDGITSQGDETIFTDRNIGQGTRRLFYQVRTLD
ncbi:MAG: hypothetical protein ACI9NC_006178 [Verrucomicrobiales bacterium]